MRICIRVYLLEVMMREWEGFRRHNNGYQGTSLSYELFVSLRELHDAFPPLRLEADRSLRLPRVYFLHFLLVVIFHFLSFHNGHGALIEDVCFVRRHLFLGFQLQP